MISLCMITSDMAGSEQAVLLGQIQTTSVNSPYVAVLLEEVKVVLSEAVAGSTARGYAGHWKRWVSFAQEHSLVPLPADPDVLCAYFLHLCSLSETLAPALSARASIGFFPKLSRPESAVPTESVRVSMCFAGLKNQFAKPLVKAMKFTPDSIMRVKDHLMQGDPVNLKDHRMAAFALCLWHCVARYEELSRVKFSDVRVLEGGSLELFVACAKNYSKDDPRMGVIAATGKEDCPVQFVLS